MGNNDDTDGWWDAAKTTALVGFVFAAIGLSWLADSEQDWLPGWSGAGHPWPAVITIMLGLVLVLVTVGREGRKSYNTHTVFFGSIVAGLVAGVSVFFAGASDWLAVAGLSPVFAFVVFSRFFGEADPVTSVSTSATNVTFVVALIVSAIYAGALYSAGTYVKDALSDRVALAVLVALSACGFTYVTDTFRTLAGEYKKQQKKKQQQQQPASAKVRSSDPNCISTLPKSDTQDS